MFLNHHPSVVDFFYTLKLKMAEWKTRIVQLDLGHSPPKKFGKVDRALSEIADNFEECQSEAKPTQCRGATGCNLGRHLEAADKTGGDDCSPSSSPKTKASKRQQ